MNCQNNCRRVFDEGGLIGGGHGITLQNLVGCVTAVSIAWKSLKYSNCLLYKPVCYSSEICSFYCIQDCGPHYCSYKTVFRNFNFGKYLDVSKYINRFEHRKELESQRDWLGVL
jgi:hypothetical protein